MPPKKEPAAPLPPQLPGVEEPVAADIGGPSPLTSQSSVAPPPSQECARVPGASSANEEADLLERLESIMRKKEDVENRMAACRERAKAAKEEFKKHEENIAAMDERLETLYAESRRIDSCLKNGC
ncbi:hypothetical protein P170DRAFT_467238 [Aspergillus steynii IBT 23096]|uniref:Uncharacterized protein n=1 Tax=Aspergillus steynii IBT 23096 TaxID=1392250 RepID=A0A2I2FZM9_9EURO|nr:uncharacterized protein P170DRAFT_467238 [Aspergillus steynii IBT 23096]PLB46081.1 hypothetical protein P170DRAFT_467238 [Aspergillus steynii IBT 23096]